MIRVLHIIDHLGLGGAQTALLDMLKSRNQTDFAVEVAVMHGRGPFADALEKLGLRVHVLSPAKWPPMYIPAFLALLRRGKFAVLHFHLQGANWLAKPLAALAGQEVRIAHDHTSGDLKFRGVASLLPDAFSHLFSTRVIAVSEGVREFLMRWEAVPGDRIAVIPNGVNIGDFRSGTAAKKAAARRRWGIPANAFVVGGMGRLAHEKNFALLPELALRHPDVFFVVAGSGPEKDALLAQAVRLGVAERVRFLGAISERSDFYQTLDVFLLPSLYEGLPMAVLEAMASGLPVLSSRLEGIASALCEEKEGLLAPAGNPDAFSEQLKRLSGSWELRRQLGAAARIKAEVSYPASNTARRVEAVYRQELSLAPGAPADKISAE
ncbi:MAG: glycosyltransferase [Verrucomicrobiota bacterium]